MVLFLIIEEAEFIMCGKSGLSTKGMGFIRGTGTQGGFGGSYAGQGGIGNRVAKEMTYGSFSQEPEFYKFHNSQMGSGGSIGNNKGGGVIVIKVKTASINGRIIADGSPDSKMDTLKNYEGASGGYIYISSKSHNHLGNKAIISANGGVGNSDETINGLSGSGGRIVLNNITGSITDQIKVSGGCANTLAPSIKNGAGGTIYLADKKELHITHTSRCISLLRTVVDPYEIIDQGVEQIYVDHQGVMAFSSNAISAGKIKAKINNLNLVNGNFTCPIKSDNSDKSLKLMELEVIYKLQMINATIFKPASDFRLKVNEFEMKHSGKIIYGNDALWLDVSQKFNISGLIFPYDLSYGEATSTSNPKVFVLAGIKTAQPPSAEEESPDFIFGAASGVMGQSIQIFSDKNITIKGNLNNYYFTHDNQLKLAQSCITVNPDQTEFTDVFRCVNQGLKGSALSQTMLINQFNTQFPSERPIEQYSELFTKMTKDYSIYIQSLGTVHLLGNLTGNRIGLCSSNLTINGIINATEGGCPHDKGVIQPSDENWPSTTDV